MLSNDMFIVHTKRPRFIAKVFEFDSESEFLVFKQVFDQQNENKAVAYSQKMHCNKFYLFSPYDYIDQCNNLEPDPKIAKVLVRMADWYRAYLIHCFNSQ